MLIYLLLYLLLSLLLQLPRCFDAAEADDAAACCRYMRYGYVSLQQMQSSAGILAECNLDAFLNLKFTTLKSILK